VMQVRRFQGLRQQHQIITSLDIPGSAHACILQHMPACARQNRLAALPGDVCVRVCVASTWHPGRPCPALAVHAAVEEPAGCLLFPVACRTCRCSRMLRQVRCACCT
jgi:hypothetical protein